MTSSTLSIEKIIESIEQAKQAGNYSAALESALQGLQTFTNDYRLYEELADIYVSEGKLEKAEEVIRYARELHPQSGTGIYLEGYIAAEMGDFDHALEVLSEANKIFPNNAEILRNIGWCYVMRGEMHQGIAFLRRALSLAPGDSRIIQNLSHALLMDDQLPIE